MKKTRTGFTLIEILVVIAIVASLIAIVTPNYLSARQRAYDTKAKSEMEQLKEALKLYYDDYHAFPAGQTSGAELDGCGTNGAAKCPVCATSDFSAGGATGCDVVYMKKFPSGFPSASGISYFQSSGRDDFCLGAKLNNASDPDLATSQARCSAPCGSQTNFTSYYWACDD